MIFCKTVVDQRRNSHLCQNDRTLVFLLDLLSTVREKKRFPRIDVWLRFFSPVLKVHSTKDASEIHRPLVYSKNIDLRCPNSLGSSFQTRQFTRNLPLLELVSLGENCCISTKNWKSVSRRTVGRPFHLPTIWTIEQLRFIIKQRRKFEWKRFFFTSSKSLRVNKSSLRLSCRESFLCERRFLLFVGNT